MFFVTVQLQRSGKMQIFQFILRMYLNSPVRIFFLNKSQYFLKKMCSQWYKNKCLRIFIVFLGRPQFSPFKKKSAAMHLAGRRKKSQSMKSPRGSVSSADLSEKCSKKSMKAGQLQTPLGSLALHFVVENAVAKSSVYDFFDFSSAPKFTVGVDPFETVGTNPTDIYVCFCDNPLGPCDTKSFGNILSLYVFIIDETSNRTLIFSYFIVNFYIHLFLDELVKKKKLRKQSFPIIWEKFHPTHRFVLQLEIQNLFLLFWIQKIP